MITLMQSEAIESLFAVLDHTEAAISGTSNDNLNKMLTIIKKAREELIVIDEEIETGIQYQVWSENCVDPEITERGEINLRDEIRAAHNAFTGHFGE